MKRAWLASIILLATFGSPHATDAGKKKKPKVESFELSVRGSHETRGGVSVSLEPSGVGTRADGSQVESWTLRVGTEAAFVTSEEPWAEVVDGGKLYQAVPGDRGLRVTVLAAGDAALEDELLVAKVEAEAQKRRIAYQSVGFVPQAGVAAIYLGHAVKARIGTWSGKLLSFEVDPFATITPALPAGAKSGQIVVDGDEVTVGGLKATLMGTALTLRKGKKHKVVQLGGDAEIVAHGKLVWLRADELIVAPAKKLAKRMISAERAITIVQAEADRRGIPHDGASASSADGVVAVTLASGTVRVVEAVVGRRSKKFLRFDVSATGLTETPADVEPEPLPDSGNAILDEHNRVRAMHCAPALTWSDELARTAQAWAEHLRDDACGFYHSSSKYGENLAGGSTGTLTGEAVVDMWYREVDLYDFNSGGFSMDTGHFTQVVWKNTQHVGCGMVSDCDGMDLWVCNYDPPGNYDKQFGKNVLPTTCN